MKNKKLEVRTALLEDIPQILTLTKNVYKNMPGYSEEMLNGQLTHFPEGHWVAVMDDLIVGYSASIIVQSDKAFKAHTWKEITGSGFGSTHDPSGEYLYGYETCVDAQFRRFKIGERFYNKRKQFVKYERLKGIVFGGRIPNFHKKKNKIKDVKDYIEQVKAKKIVDPTLSFQMRNGFEVIGILEKYIPSDVESEGFAIHLLWKNPEVYDEPKNQTGQISQQKNIHRPNSVRVVTIQYQQRGIKSFDEFAQMVEYFVDVTADYKSDFALFPELFTMQLLSIENEQIKPNKAIEKMTQYTEQIKELFQKLSIKYNVNIIAGSHPTLVEGKIRNVSYVFLRDGSIHEQAKIHPTPDERYWWNIEGGDSLKVIQTDCGPIGVLICYDSEFPELARHLVDQGMQILFVPFLTDNRQGYCRVKYCCQARAVENQIYVAMSGNVGNLPRVSNMDIQYAQSCILTPCDYPFARDGIAADTSPNVEMVAIADLRLDLLQEARVSGAVQNLKDRRHDLYSVSWHKRK
jgi:predicted amidohydrolase